MKGLGDISGERGLMDGEVGEDGIEGDESVGR